MIVYIGENIKNLRLGKSLSQEKLAQILGVTFQSVSKWERGESYPDITLLPEIAAFFKVSVDELLGTAKAENEGRINGYLELYDKMKLKDLPLTLEKFRQAKKEFPCDYRIAVRYMDLLQEEKDKPSSPDYEKTSAELMSLYENIQDNCTDDGIRIWAKRITVSHLLKKYQCTCNEKGKYYVHKEYLLKAEEIINTLPAMRDSKELWLTGLAYDSKAYYKTHRQLLEELMYMLLENTFGFCCNYAPKERIRVFEHELGLLDLLFTDGNYGKNCFHRLYTLGHLGHLYHQAGNDNKALEHLRLAAEYAKELDSKSEMSEIAIKYYNYGSPYRENNASQFMKTVMTEHYPLSDEFKQKEEFKRIVDILK